MGAFVVASIDPAKSQKAPSPSPRSQLPTSSSAGELPLECWGSLHGNRRCPHSLLPKTKGQDDFNEEKCLLYKSDDLSLVPRISVMGGESRLPKGGDTKT
ncbi:hypothetical protein APTSU1_000925100 [Apodemus speciosus]|uniref:Uncharacterized protein n=1 Tax=Apodemus speciosus TaxID=105296 RepID=A0ABQ0F403_APOSI